MFLINTPATSAETHQVSERNEIVSLKKIKFEFNTWVSYKTTTSHFEDCFGDF